MSLHVCVFVLQLNDPVSEENLLTVANQMDAAANEVGGSDVCKLVPLLSH